MGHLADTHHERNGNIHFTHCFKCKCGWAKSQYTSCQPENQETISDGRVFLLGLLGRWDLKLGYTKSIHER